MDFTSSTEKLFVKMFKSVIPPETFAMLQPDKVRGLIAAVGNKLNEIETKQNDILNTQRQILELLQHDNRNSGTGQPGSVVAIGTGTDG